MGDPHTGELHMVTDQEAKARGLIPVLRDTTELERANRQILLYSPCLCGSGKKFKFCCHKSVAQAVRKALPEAQDTA